MSFLRETFYYSMINRGSQDVNTDTHLYYGDAPHSKPPVSNARWSARRVNVPLWVVICFVILEATGVSLLIWSRCRYPNAQIIYSPAQDVVEYEVVKFNSGIFGGEAPDIYSRPPSDEVDKAWSDLYNFGISQISEYQAQRLVNATTMIPHSDSEYIVGLDVFHQLHCLNMLRKALHPDSYPSNPRESAEQREIHLAHCINSLRQSLQCSADISTIVFDKSAGQKQTPRFDILHSCRNFEKIREWGLVHQAQMFRHANEMDSTGLPE